MARRKSVFAKPRPQSHFYALQLAGEEPPSAAAMEGLYRAAIELQARRPWEEFDESMIVAVEIPGLRHHVYCSIMGMLGEVFMIQCYSGPEGYDMYRRMHSRQIDDLAEYFGSLRSVAVEYVRGRELTDPDRDVLRAMRHRPASGVLAPIFRTYRPGYHGWYPTEAESRVLTVCLRACVVVYETVRTLPNAPYWKDEGTGPFPLVTFAGACGEWRDYWIGQTAPPTEPAPVEEDYPKLDTPRVEAILRAKLAVGPAIEVDAFLSIARVGAANERKSLTRIAMAIDTQTELVYAPRVELPDRAVGEMLAGAVLETIEKTRRLPREIHVRSHERARLLSPLAQALGIPVTVGKDFRLFDGARQSMAEFGGM
jgi:hypothetical protein